MKPAAHVQKRHTSSLPKELWVLFIENHMQPLLYSVRSKCKGSEVLHISLQPLQKLTKFQILQPMQLLPQVSIRLRDYLTNVAFATSFQLAQ